ncbi:hypothetical protein BaRGS_00000171 [Batillaria attramentaria]|uniref:Histone-lysine N-methyltransferase n=1 Tax=Batillaria attramentaria TaxID=370345 RepID=A0ABD0MBB2_9CAEN
MDGQENGTGPLQGGSFHRLPQIPTMNRNTKIAQSKTSAKLDTVKTESEQEAAVIHIEGTDTVVKIGSDGTHETSDPTPAPQSDTKKARKERTGKKTVERKQDGEKEPSDLKGGRRRSRKQEGSSKRRSKAGDASRVDDTDDDGQQEATMKPSKEEAETDNPVTTDLDTSEQKNDEMEQDGSGKSDSAKQELEAPEEHSLPCDTEEKLTKPSQDPTEIKQQTAGKKAGKVEQTKESPMPGETISDCKVYVSAAGTILPRTVLLRESEKPSDSQLARIMEGKTHEFDASHPIKWHIGDLLWGHVSGHPWWPGMVSSDPFSGLYTTIKRGPGLRSISRLYHVQYFGDEAERGWVHEKSSLAFEGKQKLLDYGQKQKQMAKNRAAKTKVQQSFSPNPRRKVAWDIAVAEAEDAATLDKAERIDKYTFVYEFLPIRKPGRKSKSEEAAQSTVPNGIEKRGRKRKEPETDSVSELDEEQEEAVPAPKRRKKDGGTGGQARGGGRDEGSFETFCIKHRESVLNDHPDYSSSMVIEALRQQWTMMTTQQRMRYKSKFASNATAGDSSEASNSPPGSNKRSPRVSRPSLKKIEADEDNKVYTEIALKRPKRNEKDETDESEIPADQSEQVPQRNRRVRRRLPTQPQDEDDVISETESSNGLNVKPRMGQDSDSGSETPDGSTPRARPPKQDDDYVLEIFKLNSSFPPKKENICSVCEQPGELIECQGLCQGYFHQACLKLESAPAEDWKCPECTTGVHTCFSCKKADQETVKCSVPMCGKYYHEECVKKLPQARMEGKGFTCPLHVCATCVAESSRNPKAVKGRLYRCVRCPVAYHVGDFCIAAGSEHLAGYHIVCSGHFKPLKTLANHKRINVSWCFSCSKGGNLVCCETCPAAFHAECANLVSMPEDAWYCSDCASGKRPLYGDIIWIKIGNYRWWPGEICHPRNVPHNIQEKPHSVGEFPARFFGSHDFYWTHQGRVFSFQEGDRGSKDVSASRGLYKIYCNGVKEATEAFKLWKARKENKEQLEQEKNDRKPAPYKFIKANVPVGNVQVNKADLSEIPRCECRPDQENPCSSDTECLNRMLMYECHPQVCPAKEACQNQRFQKRQYPEVVPYRTESRGWGLKTLEDIKKGQFVNEYVGDLIDEEECKRRIKQAHTDNVTNFYMLTVDKNRIIDAGPKGNYSRFMNHSCEPNVETQKWTVNGDIRVGLFAIRDVPAGSELTFNYNLECLGNEKTKCACGSSNCSGFLGVRPKTLAAANVKKEHDDECFRCGEGGELVMCDKPNCPKVYHLQCLNLAKPPHGKWLCPWHHCDMCGKLASKLCSECPNSFCQQHAEGVISLIKDNLVCAEHTDLIQGLAASVSETTSTQSSSSASSSSGDSDDSADTKTQEPDSDDPLPPAAKKFKEDPDEAASGDADSSAAFSDTVQIKVEPPANVKTDDDTASEGEKSSLSVSWKNSPASPYSGDGNSNSAWQGKEQLKPQAAGEPPVKGRSKGRAAGSKNVCRTKARYKAQLRAGSSAAKPSPPPLPAGSSPSAHNMSCDSDNDSTELVIDIPTN